MTLTDALLAVLAEHAVGARELKIRLARLGFKVEVPAWEAAVSKAEATAYGTTEGAKPDSFATSEVKP